MTHASGRHFLQIPGPTNVPDRVLRAIDRATIDHRGPEFQKLGQEVLAGLKDVFRTKSPVIIFQTDGDEIEYLRNSIIVHEVPPGLPPELRAEVQEEMTQTAEGIKSAPAVLDQI